MASTTAATRTDTALASDSGSHVTFWKALAVGLVIIGLVMLFVPGVSFLAPALIILGTLLLVRELDLSFGPAEALDISDSRDS